MLPLAKALETGQVARQLSGTWVTEEGSKGLLEGSKGPLESLLEGSKATCRPDAAATPFVHVERR